MDNNKPIETNNIRKEIIKPKKSSKKSPKPTLKQKRYLRGLQNNILSKHPKPKCELMIAAGYSPKTANSPNIIEKQPTFQQLLTKYLPDDKLLMGHTEGLTATKTIINKNGDISLEPDYTNRHRYLETAYKLKGKIRGGEGDAPNLTQINITWGDGSK